MAEQTNEPTRQRNCPVCGGKLDSAMHCSSCGREIRLTAGSVQRRIPLSVVIFILLLATLLVYASYRYITSRATEIDGFVKVEKGVDDSEVFVSKDEYPEYSTNLEILRKMRRDKLELEREKTKILGDLGEERRIERLILNLNNGIQEHTDKLKSMEHTSPLPEESGRK